MDSGIKKYTVALVRQNPNVTHSPLTHNQNVVIFIHANIKQKISLTLDERLGDYERTNEIF